MHNNTKGYLIGFVLSLLLTMTSYIMVVEGLLDRQTLFLTVSALALTQAIVQLIYFLHIADEEGPRWHFISLLFTVGVVGIIVGGTMWIMINLRDRTMPPMDIKHLPSHHHEGM